ncbi:MAG TPA: potassium-transporting ATPase subunit KdpC [Propionibacteriaceae bacterium]
MTDTLRQLLTGLRALLFFTVLLGIAYPVVVWAIGQAAFPTQANGSLIVATGANGTSTVVGSSRIGQTFEGDQWFVSRPSAGDYDAQASAGTNLGPSDADLVADIDKRRANVAAQNGVAPAAVPADAITASASGLDPYISPAYAAIQVDRVAAARRLTPDRVRELVADQTQGRILGFLGEPRVNVLRLNLALASTQ